MLPIATLLQAQTAYLASKQIGKHKLMFGHARRAEQKRTSASTASRALGIHTETLLADLRIRQPIPVARSVPITAGYLAERHAREKNAEHPVFDAQTRRRMYTFDFCALSFERHGYLAKETVGFTKKN